MRRHSGRVLLATAIALCGVIAALVVLYGCSPEAKPGNDGPVEEKSSPAPSATAACDGGKLLWEDEFEGSGNVNANGLNVDNWTIETGLCVNDEQQVYLTDTMNVRVESGVLILEAHDVDPARRDCPGCYGDRFTSGRILSKDKREFQYGRFEARIKMPVGEGLWPAFWLLGADIDQVGWPECGELDILENVGYENWVSGAVHGPGYAAENSVTYTYTLPAGQSSADWHIYRVDWDADSIRWSVDDKLVRTLYRVTLSSQGQAWVFDHPFFVVLNLALGGHYPFGYNRVDGSAGGCYGLPGTTIEALPQRMEVDWVRVCAPPAADAP